MGPKLLTKLHLEPGGALECPGCGGRDTVEGYDGDTFSTAGIPERKIIAEGLAESSNEHCFYAQLTLCACEKCEVQSYFIEFNIVAAPEISHEWADKYFWMNEEITEPSATFTVTPHPPVADIPESWMMERTETAAGVLERHYFGLFASDWDQKVDVNTLLGRVWPLITQPERPPARVIQLRPKRNDL